MTTHSLALNVSDGAEKSAMVIKSHLCPDKVRHKRDLVMMRGGRRSEGSDMEEEEEGGGAVSFASREARWLWRSV